MLKCTNCETEIRDMDVRWAFDEPYCDDCFDEQFTYCSNCDEVIQSHHAMHNSDGDPYCESCWVHLDEEEGDTDPDAPDDPYVYDTDREFIVNLSRSWLTGKIDSKRPIMINKNDYFLSSLRDKIGRVDKSLYVFGLKDEHEYQVISSDNIITQVKEFFTTHLPNIIVNSGPGANRLGVSLSLRRDKLKIIISLITELTLIA